jgi:hypothetical protein
LIKCWCCGEEKPGDEMCGVCSERAARVIGPGEVVCLGCCICHLCKGLTEKMKEERNASC